MKSISLRAIVAVALDAEVLERRPGRGDAAGRPRADERAGQEAAVRPAAEVEVVVLRLVGVAVEDGRRRLRAEAELVQVGRDRGDTPGTSKSKSGMSRPICLHERREVAADAGVDVQPDALFVGEAAELRDRVDAAVREVRRRADQHDRVGIDGGLEPGEVDAEVGARPARGGPRGPSASPPC